MTLTNQAMADALERSTGLVSLYRREGMPMADPEAARAWIKANKRARAAPSIPSDAPPANGNGKHKRPKSKPDPFTLARTRREQADADLAEIRLRQYRGDLVSAADVRAKMAQQVAAVRTSLLQIAGRLAPQLVAEVDQAKIVAAIDAEIRQALTQFAPESV